MRLTIDANTFLFETGDSRWARDRDGTRRGCAYHHTVGVQRAGHNRTAGMSGLRASPISRSPARVHRRVHRGRRSDRNRYCAPRDNVRSEGADQRVGSRVVDDYRIPCSDMSPRCLLWAACPDVWGHRNVYVASMLVFMAGSVAAALTTSLTWLVAARIVQAIGAGALVPISIAIVGDLFEPERRAMPLGLMGASAEAGGVIGPLWGGLISRYLDWPWVFWINIPLGALVLVMLLLMLGPSPRYPRANRLHRRRPDCGQSVHTDAGAVGDRRAWTSLRHLSVSVSRQFRPVRTSPEDDL